MGYTWEGEIRYPMSFNVRDHYNDLDFYMKALLSGVPSESFKKEVYKNIADIVVGESDEFEKMKSEINKAPTGSYDINEEMSFEPHTMVNPNTGESAVAQTYEQHLRLADEGYIHE